MPNRAGRPEANTLHRLPAAAGSDCLRRVMEAGDPGSGAEPRHLRAVGPEALPAGGVGLASATSDRAARVVRPSRGVHGDRGIMRSAWSMAGVGRAASELGKRLPVPHIAVRSRLTACGLIADGITDNGRQRSTLTADGPIDVV
jgi:hypothetical protein